MQCPFRKEVKYIKYELMNTGYIRKLVPVRATQSEASEVIETFADCVEEKCPCYKNGKCRMIEITSVVG